MSIEPEQKLLGKTTRSSSKTPGKAMLRRWITWRLFPYEIFLSSTASGLDQRIQKIEMFFTRCGLYPALLNARNFAQVREKIAISW
jgi:hypothetical protein